MKRLIMAMIGGLLAVAPAEGYEGWFIFDASGNPELLSAGGKKTVLTREKNLLMEVSPGSTLRLPAGGRLVLVSGTTGEAYELKGDATMQVREKAIAGAKANISVRPGFSVPKKKAQNFGGLVIRSGAKKDCLAVDYLTETVVAEPPPELRWRNSCGAGKVVVTVFSDGGEIYRQQTGGTSICLPPGILSAGKRYTWLVEWGDGVETAAGAFRTIALEQADELAGACHNGGGRIDLPERLSCLFYLKEKGLRRLAEEELACLKKAFPEVEALRNLQ
jgi:hypothetical protein